MSATPRPWKSGEYSSGTDISGPNGRTVCFLAVDRHDEGPVAEESRANAALIVRAVNTFDAAKAALETSLDWLETELHACPEDFDNTELREHVANIKAVLAAREAE